MCEIVLPERAPTFLGVIELKGKVKRLNAAEGVRVKVNGRLVQKAILRSSKEAKPSFITWNDMLRLVVHEHAGKPAVRIWDNLREERFSLPPLKWFPINKELRIAARYTRFPDSRKGDHPDTFGELVEDRLDGYVTFKYMGNKYKLDVTETRNHTLFIKFQPLLLYGAGHERWEGYFGFQLRIQSAVCLHSLCHLYLCAAAKQVTLPRGSG
jgi:uncharacterized protein (DUF1684 family)